MRHYEMITHHRAVALLVLLSFNVLGQTSGSDVLFPIVQNGKMGYISKTGQILIRPQFDTSSSMGGISQINFFSEDLAAVNSNKKIGYIDTSGKFIIAAQFNEGRPFVDGLAAVKIKDKWGYIDKQGSIAIPPQFSEVSDFSEGLAQVEIGGKVGYIDKNGKVIIEPRFRPAKYPDLAIEGDFRDGIANVRDGLNYVMIGPTGKIVGKCLVDCITNFYEGLAVIQSYSDRKWLMGYMDKKGVIAIEPKFSKARKFSEGLAVVSLEPVRSTAYEGSPQRVLFYIDATGQRAIQGDFYRADRFSEGLAAVARDNYLKVGYIDRTGSMVIKAQFDRAGQFKGGVAPVIIGGKWGYINKAGNYVWEPSN